MTTAMPVRTFGVEEEFLLVDRATWRPAPVADKVVADCADARPAGGVQPELTLEQVETVTPVLRNLDDLRSTLVDLRRQVALAAERHGAALVASGTSPFPVRSHRTPSRRYQQMASAFGITAREQLTCGCHVHVA